jgi:hypothetical protein
MLIPVMQQVAALAESLQIARTVVCWIMVEMRRRQIHARGADLSQRDCLEPMPQKPALAVAPRRALCVPPTSVAEADDDPTMRPRAMFAAAFRPLEADHDRKLPPIDRIEPAKLRPDGHVESIADNRCSRQDPEVLDGSCSALTLNAPKPGGSAAKALEARPLTSSGEVSKAVASARLRPGSTGGAARRERGNARDIAAGDLRAGAHGGDYSQSGLSELTIATERAALASATNRW